MPGIQDGTLFVGHAIMAFTEFRQLRTAPSPHSGIPIADGAVIIGLDLGHSSADTTKLTIIDMFAATSYSLVQSKGLTRSLLLLTVDSLA
jgi:hypothetical protein